MLLWLFGMKEDEKSMMPQEKCETGELSDIVRILKLTAFFLMIPDLWKVPIINALNIYVFGCVES